MRKFLPLLASALVFSCAPARAQNTIAGNLTVQQAARFTGQITPPTLAADVNDYAPASFAASTFLRLQADAPRLITGLAGGASGRVVWLSNVGAYPITLANLSTASAAGNRVDVGGANYEIPAGIAVGLWYDATSSRWRPLSGLSAGGGGSGVGTVTSVSVTSSNGVSATVASPTTTPTLTFSLGAIAPASVSASGNVTGANLSGTNTGDQTDASLPFSDVTAGNVSTARHGFAPKLPNDAGKFLDGTGAWTAPAGSGGTVDQTARDAAAAAQATANAANTAAGTAQMTAQAAQQTANAAETPLGAQTKANAAQAAAIASAAGSLSTHVSAADPHGDRAFAVQRANHTGTQAGATITQDSTHRFATDAEKTAWNAKPDAPANAATLAKISESAGAPIWNGGAWPGGGGGSGTVTAVSITSANGISGTVAAPTITPAITLSLGAITPSSVAAVGTVTGSNLSGTNTGDQSSVTGNAGTASALATARTINGVPFDGTANITAPAAAGTLTGTALASGVTSSSLTSAAGGSFGTAAFTAATAYDPAGAAAAITLSGLSGVPSSRTVNGHTLTGNVSVTAGDVGLGSVENTALSTWAGSANLTTTGTIASGTWHGAAIADAYIAGAAAWNAKTSFPGFGTTGATAAAGNDARLSDSRTPLAHTQAAATISDSTTAGRAFLTLPNPGAVSFPRVNADNTASALSASDFRAAIGAGTSTFDGAFSSLTGTPSTFTPAVHNQAWSTITGTPTTLSGYGIADAFDGAYSSLSGVPSTFAPAAHNQAWGTISGTPTTLGGYGIADAQPLDAGLSSFAALADASGVLTNNGAGVLTWTAGGGGSFDGAYSSLTGVPTEFTPAAHTQTASTISDSTAPGRGFLTTAVAGVVAFPRVNVDNTVDLRNATSLLSDLGASTMGKNILAVPNITAVSFLRLNADESVTAQTAANYRTDLGGTTIGQSLFSLTNPSAITFPRFNANNTVDALTAASFVTAIGAGNVVGPASSVQYGIPFYNNTTGKLLAQSTSIFTNSSGQLIVGGSSPGDVFSGSSAKLQVQGMYGIATNVLSVTGTSLFETPLAGVYITRNQIHSYGESGIGADLSIRWGASSKMRISNTGYQLYSFGAGTLVTDSSGNVTVSSDRRLKNVSGKFTRGLDAILQIQPKVFTWKPESGMNTEDVNVGFIAQDVLPAIPEAIGMVKTTETEEADPQDATMRTKKTKREGAAFMTLSDRPIIAALVNAVRELNDKNAALEARIADLETSK